MRTSTPLSLLTLLVATAACSFTPEDVRQAVHTGAGPAYEAVIPSALAESDLGERSDRIADVAEATVPAVVHIASERRVRGPDPRQLMPFGFRMPPEAGERIQRGQGSGVLVDRSGLILTNNHVVDGADELEVTLSDGRTFDAVARGTDPATDLAVLELTGGIPDDLPALEFGDSDTLRLGETVLAIGNPFGLQGTVTMGIVSAVGRADMGIAAYEDFIQTDAAINPGNSGGALVSLDGRLVGINTAIASRSGGYQGIGFAIPANLARDIADRLRADGTVVRGYLGVGIQDVDPRMAARLGLGDRPKGALVNHVEPDSAAAEAGLRVGDVILEVDGEPIGDPAELRRVVSLKGADTAIRLALLRDGRNKRVQATLGVLPGSGRAAAPSGPEADDAPVDAIAGLRVQPLDDALRQRLGLPGTGEGLVVVGVRPGSAADAEGLKRGDVIREVNGSPARRPRVLADALQGGGPAMLLVQRGELTRFFVLEADAE